MHYLNEGVEQRRGLTMRICYLIELLLSEIIVVMHGLNEGVERVDGRVAHALVVPLQRLHHFDAHLLPKSARKQR